MARNVMGSRATLSIERSLVAMPRPLKSLNPYASWPALFGAAVQQLRLRLRAKPPVSQEELGKRIAYAGSTVSAIERGVLRPDERFVDACERELAASNNIVTCLLLAAGCPLSLRACSLTSGIGKRLRRVAMPLSSLAKRLSILSLWPGHSRSRRTSRL
jgi:DNA-binding XRE family transcriptional regulator